MTVSDQIEKNKQTSNLSPSQTASRILRTRSAWPAQKTLSPQPTARRSVLKILGSRSARRSASVTPTTLSATIRPRL